MSTVSTIPKYARVHQHMVSALKNVNEWIPFSPYEYGNLFTLVVDRSGRGASVTCIGATLCVATFVLPFGSGGTITVTGGGSGTNKFKITTDVSSITNVYVALFEFV